MPLQKIQYKPGVNRENTRYTTEGGWYECNKIRFRQGNPEKIGGWVPVSTNTYAGVCRSLWNWVTLAGENLVGVGTNLQFYIMNGGAYYDITPIRVTTALTSPFTATNGSSVIQVHDVAHGCNDGDYVIFSGDGITGLGGNVTAAVLKGTFQIAYLNADNYSITVSVTANATDAAGSPGGGTVVTQYEVNTGPSYQIPLVGWGAGPWGYGGWGIGQPTNTAGLQLWSQANFGEDLIYGPKGQGIYYWNASTGYTPLQVTISISTPGVITLPVGFSISDGTAISLTSTGHLPTGLSVGTVYFVVGASSNTFRLATSIGGTPINTTGTQAGLQYISQRGVNLADAGDADTPLFQYDLLVSDASRFILVFGTNDYGQDYLDPMLIRWSNQEDPYTWTPDATNQAGSIRLSRGSKIVTALQTRQEIVTFTDSALYSLQYVGPPYVWSSQLLGDNISIIGPNAVALASGIVYWMGRDKFYMYNGNVSTLNCDLRRYVFQDFNTLQPQQVYAGTNEQFNEVWWFYCSANSNVIDRYVIFNYLENTWYYGTMGRTAWLDSGMLEYPIGATYNSELVQHENGVDAYDLGVQTAIDAYISSSEFDIGDGHNFGYVWRILPDLTFSGSSTAPDGTQPTVTMTLYPMQNSGTGTGYPGVDTVVRGQTYNITEEFTGQVYTRVRGRQLIFKVGSNQIGTTWQLGAPRLDIRPDGRR